MTTPHRLPEHASPRNLTELHPEELFDKLDRDELNDAEARALAEHLQRCAACRAEREARTYFRRALTVDHGALEIALGGALGRLAEERVEAPHPRVAGPASSPRVPSKARPTRAPHRGHRRTGALVVGMLLLAGAAAAIGGVATSKPIADQSQPAAGPATWREEQAAPAEPRTRARGEGGLADVGELGSSRLAAAQPDPAASTPLRRPASRGTNVSSRQSNASAAPATNERRDVSRAPVRPVPIGSPSASSLFRRANAARSQGKLERAEALYGELIHRYPTARESAAARALLAQLALDHGSPDQALAAYDAYMHHGASPALREEALVGRARALQSKGDGPREIQAWRELLERFPKSAAAGEARRRLQALSGP